MRRTGLNVNINTIENVLKSTLAPVNPRPDYITNLKMRLMDVPYQHSHLPNSIALLIITSVALLSSLIFIITSIRAVIAMSSAIHYIRYSVLSRNKIEIDIPDSNLHD